jgi:pyruvate/2-oxoglutarate dehydrogenase complex dihydrolipoamide acyltransferase (E2) component
VLFLVHGELTARKLITITATADQRFIDGYQAGALAEIAQASFGNPVRFGT